jgi:hypothetical protein
MAHVGVKPQRVPTVEGVMDFDEVASYLGVYPPDLWKLHPWPLWTPRMIAFVEVHDDLYPEE